MKLQLSGKDESSPAFLRANLNDEAYQRLESILKLLLTEEGFAGLELYKEFPGRAIDQMPLLVKGENEFGNVVDIPREPVSYAVVLKRRMEAPKDVIETWQDTAFLTGDGYVAGTKGDSLIVLDAQALHELTAESELEQGALVLPDGAWEELMKQKDKVVYLTAEEVQEAHGKGYVKKDGIWVPANRTVGKVWDTLSRGQNISSCIELASENSPYSTSLLNVRLGRPAENGKPTMRSWYANSSVDDFSAHSGLALDDHHRRLAGIVDWRCLSSIKRASHSSS